MKELRHTGETVYEWQNRICRADSRRGEICFELIIELTIQFSYYSQTK